MTYFRIDIQLPLRYNPKSGQTLRDKIPEELFHKTYEELLNMVGGISTSNTPICGSWINPKDKNRYNDRTILFSVVVESEDKATIFNVPKIQELKRYKETLKERFKQYEIFMIATRCTWL